jgi:hypothetical protein
MSTHQRLALSLVAAAILAGLGGAVGTGVWDGGAAARRLPATSAMASRVESGTVYTKLPPRPRRPHRIQRLPTRVP